MLKTYGGNRLIRENSRIARILAVKLHASSPAGLNAFTGYGEDYVMVNGERRDSSVVVLRDRVLDWSVAAFDRLTAEDFEFLRTLEVEIVLLGTGPRQRFPHPRLTAALPRAGIGLEVMDLQAACRTYNILVAEERKVAAALLFE
jgi:uncharacterized protein